MPLPFRNLKSAALWVKLRTLGRRSTMLSFIRGGFAVALLAFAPLAAGAAEKPFQDQRLGDSAGTAGAEKKQAPGPPPKPLAQIRRDADAAFTKNDFRGGMALLGQIVASAPSDGATWLRLARTVMQIRPADDNEKNLLLERASTAAYIAYQRSTNRTEEADSLAFLGNVMGQREQWRAALDALRLSLELRESAAVAGRHDKIDDED